MMGVYCLVFVQLELNWINRSVKEIVFLEFLLSIPMQRLMETLSETND